MLEAFTHSVVTLLSVQLLLVERQHGLHLALPSLVVIDIFTVLFEVLGVFAIVIRHLECLALLFLLEIGLFLRARLTLGEFKVD